MAEVKHPEGKKPWVQVAGGSVEASTTYVDELPGGRTGKSYRVTDAKVKVHNDEGWLTVDLELPEDRIIGYAVTVNGKSLPLSDERTSQ